MANSKIRDQIDAKQRLDRISTEKYKEIYGTTAEFMGDNGEDSDKFSIADIVEGISNSCTLYHDDEIGIPFIIYKGRCLDFNDSINSIISSYVYEEYRTATKYKTDIYDILLMRAEDRRIKTYIRTAFVGGKIYYKLNSNEMIEISQNEWKKIPHNHNIIFRPNDLSSGQRDPVGGGNLYELLDNIQINKHEKLLLCGALCASVIADINHPIINISGAQGSGKTTISKYLKSIIDPNGSNVGSMREEKDMILALSQNIVYVFDNLSHLSQNQSDILAQAATGGSIDMRELYKTAKMRRVVFNPTVITNSIIDTFTKSDVLDRTIKIELQRIKAYKGSNVLVKDNRETKILGAIFDALVYVLKNRDKYDNDVSPIRLADYYIVTVLCAEYCGFSKEEVDEAFVINTDKNINQSIGSSYIGDWIIENIRENNSFSGTTSDLYDKLGKKNPYKSARSLGINLSKLKTNLSLLGYIISDKNTKTKKYEIVYIDPDPIDDDGFGDLDDSWD